MHGANRYQSGIKISVWLLSDSDCVLGFQSFQLLFYILYYYN